jgi:stage III sporulation protein AB
MFILKCVNLILIILIPSYIGIYKSKIFKNRTMDLKETKVALGMLRSKIEFTYEPIGEIFMRYF